MKIKFGALVVAGSGKAGGHVGSRNKGGPYLRTKVTPNNPSSDDQVAVRNHFTANAQGWKGLTVAQRKDWNTAVQNFIGTDIFGDSKVLSGFQLFVRLNNMIRFIGKTPITDPPVPASVTAFTAFTAAPDRTIGDCDLTYAPAVGAAETAIIDATPGLSAGVSFVKSEYRKIRLMLLADISPFNLFADYETKFGTFPAVGSKIFFRGKFVTWASGLFGSYAQDAQLVV